MIVKLRFARQHDDEKMRSLSDRQSRSVTPNRISRSINLAHNKMIHQTIVKCISQRMRVDQKKCMEYLHNSKEQA